MRTEMELARRNQKYYLQEQKADSNTQYWFKYVKTLSEYTEPILVTPEMAQEIVQASGNKDLRIPDAIVINFGGRIKEGSSLAARITKPEVVVFYFNVSEKFA